MTKITGEGTEEPKNKGIQGEEAHKVFWAEKLRLPNAAGVCARGWQSLFANREFGFDGFGCILPAETGRGGSGAVRTEGWVG